MNDVLRTEYDKRRSELERLNDLAAQAAASGDPERCHDIAERLAALEGRVRTGGAKLLELRSQAANIRRDLIAIARGERPEDAACVWAEGAD